jgi:DNA-binding transcriptional ArsR family regulator
MLASMSKKSAAQAPPTFARAARDRALRQPQQELLDSVFFALSDPVRRGIVEQLQSGPLLVSELAEPFSITIQAISRHIQVLEEAGLVQKERSGRIRRCSLDVGPILDVVTWLNRYSHYWQGQFAQLSTALGHGEGAKLKSGSAEATPRARSKARPVRSADRRTKRAR